MKLIKYIAYCFLFLFGEFFLSEISNKMEYGQKGEPKNYTGKVDAVGVSASHQYSH